ncbi:MAG TPA: hypothetical protein VF635_06765 [Propionibacteriaceae bacterium]
MHCQKDRSISVPAVSQVLLEAVLLDGVAQYRGLARNWSGLVGGVGRRQVGVIRLELSRCRPAGE